MAIAPTLFVILLGANGKSLPTSVNDSEITTIGSVSGEYFTQDQVAVMARRIANPKSTHEMVTTAETAKLAGWRLGETVEMGDFTVAQINSGVNPATAKPALKFSVQLVGLVVFSNQVASDDIDRYSTHQLLTPALTERLHAGATYPDYGLRLRGNSRAVAGVEQETTRLVPKGTPYAFLVTSVTEGRVERPSEPEAIALAVALSPLAPLGPARQVDRTPRFAFDWTVLGAGFAILAVGLSALTVVLAQRRAARRRIGQGSEPVQQGSAVVNAAARHGLPAPAVVVSDSPSRPVMAGLPCRSARCWSGQC